MLPRTGTDVRALVTGGAGFIGHHLVGALHQRGAHVTVLDDLSTGSLSRLEPYRSGIEFLEGSILDSAVLARSMQGCEVVFHLAAMASVVRSFEDPALCDEINVIGTMRVVEAARRAGVSRVVLVSSAAVYGTPPTLPCHEEMVPLPMSPYGASKLAAEHYLHILGEDRGIATVALRFFNVFGPGQDPASDYAAVVPAWITTILHGERPTINGDGEITRDFIHVDNAVAAMLLAGSPTAPTRLTCNIASGQGTSLRKLLASIDSGAQRTSEPIIGPARSGDIRHSVADISRAANGLGYEVVVPLDEGIVRTVAWYSARATQA
jgi:UDP-glucose 4-epimerase